MGRVIDIKYRGKPCVVELCGDEEAVDKLATVLDEAVTKENELRIQWFGVKV